MPSDASQSPLLVPESGKPDWATKQAHQLAARIIADHRMTSFGTERWLRRARCEKGMAIRTIERLLGTLPPIKLACGGPVTAQKLLATHEHLLNMSKRPEAPNDTDFAALFFLGASYRDLAPLAGLTQEGVRQRILPYVEIYDWRAARALYVALRVLLDVDLPFGYRLLKVPSPDLPFSKEPARSEEVYARSTKHYSLDSLHKNIKVLLQHNRLRKTVDPTDHRYYKYYLP